MLRVKMREAVSRRPEDTVRPSAPTIRLSVRPSQGRTHHAGGYGVGVANRILSAYWASTATRIARRDAPWSFIAITTRVTPRQMSQVGAIASNTTEPSGLTVLT